MEERIRCLILNLNNNNGVKFMTSLDNQVFKNIKAAEIDTRKANSNGLWCCMLLPIILINYSIQCQVSPLYKLVAFTSMGVLFYCFLFIIFLSISHLVLKRPTYGVCMAASLVSMLSMYTFLNYDLMFSAMFAVPTILTYSWMLRLSLNKFQNTFTVGEAMLITQGIIYCTVMALAKLFCNYHETDEEKDFLYTVIYTVLSTVGFMVTVLYLLPNEHRNPKSVCCIFGAGAAFELFLLINIMGIYSPFTILYYVILQNDRYHLFLFWLILLVFAVAILTMRTGLAVKASTVTRKSFHVLASAVFLSGILADVNLMILASGIVFGILILVEALRKANVEPISSALQSAFLVYSDEKDSGCFAMTPIYLYVGLSCPLLLVPQHEGYELELLSGVLSIGVGDTAASWFGSKYGYNKWTGGNRTYEGTVFNILAQIATVYALLLLGLLNTENALLRTTIAAVFTGLVEAKTNQVDNLVLPLVMIIAFQCTWFLN